MLEKTFFRSNKTGWKCLTSSGVSEQGSLKAMALVYILLVK